MRLAEHIALTEFAYRIEPASVDALLGQGARVVVEGSQLQPRKDILVVASGTPVPASAVSIAVRIGPEFLAAEAVLLVAFPRDQRASWRPSPPDDDRGP